MGLDAQKIRHFAFRPYLFTCVDLFLHKTNVVEREQYMMFHCRRRLIDLTFDVDITTANAVIETTYTEVISSRSAELGIIIAV